MDGAEVGLDYNCVLLFFCFLWSTASRIELLGVLFYWVGHSSFHHDSATPPPLGHKKRGNIFRDLAKHPTASFSSPPVYHRELLRFPFFLPDSCPLLQKLASEYMSSSSLKHDMQRKDFWRYVPSANQVK